MNVMTNALSPASSVLRTETPDGGGTSTYRLLATPL